MTVACACRGWTRMERCVMLSGMTATGHVSASSCTKHTATLSTLLFLPLWNFLRLHWIFGRSCQLRMVRRICEIRSCSVGLLIVAESEVASLPHSRLPRAQVLLLTFSVFASRSLPHRVLYPLPSCGGARCEAAEMSAVHQAAPTQTKTSSDARNARK